MDKKGKKEKIHKPKIPIGRKEAFCRYMSAKGTKTWGNQTQSAIAAGYSEKRAASRGYEFCKLGYIRQRIAVLEAERFINNMATQRDSVVQNFEHIRTVALEAGNFSVAKDCTTKLGELNNLFPQKPILHQTIEQSIRPILSELSPEGRADYHRQTAAIESAAAIYKKFLAPAQESTESIASFVPAIINAVKIKTSNNTNSVAPDEIDTSDERIFEATERISADEVGKIPGRPTHSLNTFE